MEEATTVFLAGILAVFLGMTLIYVTILITSRIVDYLESDEDTP